MSAQTAPASEHIMSVKTNLLVFAGLMVLLIATLVAAQFDLGLFNVVIALAIAVAKALLITCILCTCASAAGWRGSSRPATLSGSGS